MTSIFHKGILAVAVPTALALLLGLSPPAATPSRAVTLTVGTASGQVGDTVELPVTLSELGPDQIYSFELDFSWSSSYATCVGISTTGTLASAWVTHDLPGSGTVTVTGAGASPLAGDGILVKLQMQLGPSVGVPTITLSSALFNEGSPIPTVVNGSLSISAAPTINVNPDVGLMAVGDSLQFATSGGTVPYTYSSSDPAVADFVGANWLYALGPGEVQVYSEDAGAIRDTTTGHIEVRAFRLVAGSVSANTEDIILVPIVLDDPTGFGIVSAEFSLTWAANNADFLGFETTGTLMADAGWASPYYTNSPGMVNLAAAGVTPLSGSGVLVYLRFQVFGSTWLYPSPGIFNEEFPALPTNGYLTVTPGPTIGISPGTASMLIGDLLPMSVTGSPTYPISWSTDDPLTAYFLMPGKLLALEEGVVHAMVTDDIGISAVSGDIQICSLGLPPLVSSIRTSATSYIPVRVNRTLDVLDIYSLEMEFFFDSTRVDFDGILTAGTLTQGWVSPTVVVEGNYIRVYQAGASPLTGCGPLLILQFTGKPDLTTPYTGVANSAALFNEGFPCAKLNTGVSCDNLSDVPGAVSGLKLWPNRPNPFNPLTEIRFELTTAQHVLLQVHDPAGRLVRTLVDEARGAGLHRAVWNGLDQAGVMAGSGVYFYSLRSGTEHRLGKMVLLK